MMKNFYCENNRSPFTSPPGPFKGRYFMEVNWVRFRSDHQKGPDSSTMIRIVCRDAIYSARREKAAADSMNAVPTGSGSFSKPGGIARKHRLCVKILYHFSLTIQYLPLKD
jgi:hypothetical protein